MNIDTLSHNTKLMRIEAQKLRAHPTAQRALSVSRVRKMADALDLDAIGTLHAVEYFIAGQDPQAPWIIDGQTRLHALLKRGLGEWEVDVLFHLDVKDDQRAADLFLKLNKRTLVSAWDTYRNALTARWPDALAINDIAAANGLDVTCEGGDGKLTCVNALMNLYAVDEGAALTATLETVVAAWGGTRNSIEGKIIEGVGLVFKTYGRQLDRAALVRCLSKYPGGATHLLGNARERRNTRHATLGRIVGELIVEYYNNKRTTHALQGSL